MSEPSYKDFYDNSNPLLEKFKDIAPSSFKHCNNVANFCDSIAGELPDDIVNKDRLRCSAIFHDVGKIFNPKYFCENLVGEEENPHDKMDPYLSYQIISRHVSDGAALLLEWNFPLDVIKNVLHHHGSCVIHYFYCKSKSTDEDVYRYKFSSPPTVESAILMICDVVESTARSLYIRNELNDEETKVKLVSDTIEKLTDDGQIDKLELGIVRVVRRILPKELSSIYHKRVEYPEEKKSKKNN
ncbi:HD domain-containing protein [Candidatus Pacearchaeota archaeon]|jgi:hypothetical protein|nr:HD domain-containing protein [bacterium]MCK9597142.1 HD domain-containing protein [Candidatus Pacearchaeota archaeon]